MSCGPSIGSARRWLRIASRQACVLPVPARPNRKRTATVPLPLRLADCPGTLSMGASRGLSASAAVPGTAPLSVHPCNRIRKCEGRSTSRASPWQGGRHGLSARPAPFGRHVYPIFAGGGDRSGHTDPPRRSSAVPSARSPRFSGRSEYRLQAGRAGECHPYEVPPSGGAICAVPLLHSGPSGRSLLLPWLVVVIPNPLGSWEKNNAHGGEESSCFRRTDPVRCRGRCCCLAAACPLHFAACRHIISPCRSGPLSRRTFPLRILSML